MNKPHSHIASAVLVFLLAILQAGCTRENSSARRLRDAIESGDTAAALAMLDEMTQEDMNAPGADRRTVLHRAFDRKNKEVYAKLLARGANPNLCAENGECIMNLAAVEADAYWLREALAHGGDPNAPNTGHLFGLTWTPLFYALNANQAENVRMLIKSGADVNYQTDRGVVPLALAMGVGAFESLVDMLNAGADPEKEDHYGQSFIDLWFDGRPDRPPHLDQADVHWV